MTHAKKIIIVAGARPNFVKIAPIIEALGEANRKAQVKLFEPILVHTGQHYDEKMSDVFFADLEIPKPNLFLGVGSGSHAELTANIMLAFEKVCLNEKPDLLLVVGDVNSTLACSLVASKLGIRIAHIEAGLRSGDRSMPEEINRIVTDALSDYLFVSEESGIRHLLEEGKKKEQIFHVGNVMIDTLYKYREKAKRSHILKRLNAAPKQYGVVTLHRPSNVDQKETLSPILEALSQLAERIPLFFPVHPRTKQQIQKWNLERYFLNLPAENHGIYWSEPLGYLDFLCLMDYSKIILTDSGGIQEETTALKIPCLTLRENTERPVTITEGTNLLVGTNPDHILKAGMNIIENGQPEKKVPLLWDGNTAKRIVHVLQEVIC